MEDNKIDADEVLRLMWSGYYSLSRPSSTIIPELIAVIKKLAERIERLEEKSEGEYED